MDLEEFNRRMELFQKEHFGSLEDNSTSLEEILKVHGDICDQLFVSKRNFPSWQTFFETLIFKLITSSFSIVNLAKGTIIKSGKYGINAPILDYPSIYILTRATLENFLTLDYIFFNNLSLEERLFRFKLWEVSGLLSRQNFSTLTNKEFEIQKQFEKQEIDKILAELSKMPEFTKLDKKQLRNLSRFGLPRLESWNSLILSSNLNKQQFSNTYSLLSSYAHSEYLSILQIKQTSLAANNPETQELVNTCFFTLKSVHCLSIHWLISEYEECKAYFDGLPEVLQSNINIWAALGREQNKV
ncbi:MAG: hypothetical protein ACO1OF_13955 [Adhaeribacter sp.]